MNNREFHEMLQEYFQSNTMTLDEFLEHLPRFMMQNYGLHVEGGEDGNYPDEELEDEIDDAEDSFISFLRQSGGNASADPASSLNTSEVLMRSLLAGQREIREIPLRTILPQSPPPSPTPNLAATPQVPVRSNGLRRVPSQLRNSALASAASFDPNGSTDKSPSTSPVLPADLNNDQFEQDLPLTSEFMRRYGYARIRQHSSRQGNSVSEDRPER